MQANHPEAVFETGPPETIFEKLFGSNEAPFEVRLWSGGKEAIPSPELLTEIARAIEKESGRATGRKVPLQEVYEISPRFDRIKLYDVSLSRLTSILKKSLNRLPVFTLRQGQYEVPVVLTGKQEDIYSVIRKVRVQSEKKGSIPVDQLVTLKRVAGYKVLQGGKEDSYASLSFDLPDNELEGCKPG